MFVKSTLNINKTKLYTDFNDFIQTNDLQEAEKTMFVINKKAFTDLERIKNILYHIEPERMNLVRLIPDTKGDFQVQIIEIQEGEINISRNAFMNFFRSDNFHEHIDPDDAHEIFLSVLHGGSDITAKTLNNVISEYSAENVIAIEPKTTYFLLGQDAKKSYENDGIEQLILENNKGNIEFATFEFIEGETPVHELLEAMDGWSDYTSMTEEDYNKFKNI